jgi:hypothetical protein
MPSKAEVAVVEVSRFQPLEIHISTRRPKSHLDNLPSSPSHALTQVMRDLAGQAGFGSTFGSANCKLRIILFMLSILGARISHHKQALL